MHRARNETCSKIYCWVLLLCRTRRAGTCCGSFRIATGGSDCGACLRNARCTSTDRRKMHRPLRVFLFGGTCWWRTTRMPPLCHKWATRTLVATHWARARAHPMRLRRPQRAWRPVLVLVLVRVRVAASWTTMALFCSNRSHSNWHTRHIATISELKMSCNSSAGYPYWKLRSWMNHSLFNFSCLNVCPPAWYCPSRGRSWPLCELSLGGSYCLSFHAYLSGITGLLIHAHLPSTYLSRFHIRYYACSVWIWDFFFGHLSNTECAHLIRDTAREGLLLALTACNLSAYWQIQVYIAPRLLLFSFYWDQCFSLLRKTHKFGQFSPSFRIPH